MDELIQLQEQEEAAAREREKLEHEVSLHARISCSIPVF